MHHYILFGTSGCHLCEEAETLLDKMQISYDYLDIMDKEVWQAEYGLTIPVIFHDSKGKLYWPFDEEKIRNFLVP